MCKIVLGRIRGKYKSKAPFKFELDGDILLSEGNSELRKRKTNI